MSVKLGLHGHVCALAVSGSKKYIIYISFYHILSFYPTIDSCQLQLPTAGQEEKGKCEIKYFDPTEHRIETMPLAAM